MRPGLALADALDLRGVQRIDLRPALALILEADLDRQGAQRHVDFAGEPIDDGRNAVAGVIDKDPLAHQSPGPNIAWLDKDTHDVGVSIPLPIMTYRKIGETGLPSHFRAPLTT
jgi:hypothetical protein